MGEGDEKAGFGFFAAGEVANFCGGVEVEGLAEFVCEGFVPFGVEGLGVPHEFVDAHPAGEVAIFGEVADFAEDAFGVLDGVFAEDVDGAGVGFEEAEDVSDEGGFAGAVFADESEDGALGDGEGGVVYGGFFGEAAG